MAVGECYTVRYADGTVEHRGPDNYWQYIRYLRAAVKVGDCSASPVVKLEVDGSTVEFTSMWEAYDVSRYQQNVKGETSGNR